MQNINLYDALPHAPTDWLRASRFIQLSVGFIFLLVIVSLIGKVQQSVLSYQAEQLDKKQVQAVHQLEEIKILYPDAAKNEPLDQQLSQLSDEINSKTYLLKRLSGAYKAQRFADYMTALAKCDFDEVWLVQIHMKQEGDITLIGMTQEANHVVQFVQMANQIPPFAKHHLEIIKMNQNKSTKMVEFNLATT